MSDRDLLIRAHAANRHDIPLSVRRAWLHDPPLRAQQPDVPSRTSYAHTYAYAITLCVVAATVAVIAGMR